MNTLIISSADSKPALVNFTATTDSKPEWLRLPAPGSRCRFTGLSRSTLNELTIPGPANDGRPPVKSVVLRKRGAVRGIRLISYESLMGYLAGLGERPSSTRAA